MSEDTQKPVDFEHAIQRLEEIVHALEDGDVGLQESLDRYEEGVKLLRQCYDLLERAQRRIELLTGVDAEGNPITRPLEDQATLAAEPQQPRRSRRRTLGGSSSPDNGGPTPPAGKSNMDEPEGLF